MASELRVNTLKDAAGNNSIATSFVAGGSAKAWINFNGTGTVAIRDSFNIASLTDAGTGLYNCAISSDFTNANFSTTGAAGENADNGGNRMLGLRAKSTGSQNCRGFADGISAQDLPELCFHCMGDLA